MILVTEVPNNSLMRGHSLDILISHQQTYSLKMRPAIIYTLLAIRGDDCGCHESTGQETDGCEAHFFAGVVTMRKVRT